LKKLEFNEVVIQLKEEDTVIFFDVHPLLPTFILFQTTQKLWGSKVLCLSFEKNEN